VVTICNFISPGPDADVTISTPHENKEIVLEMQRVIIKSGEVLVEQGEIRKTLIGKPLHVSPNQEIEVEPEI
jgi:formylmethanofuran dehydrogenase subunit A